ncbi:MAG TPA: glutamyl-tRNA reductase [Chthoniobacterales bacterium]|jgi:glutamyl-tRNA reductase
MKVFCVGLSHHTANVETRERFVGHAQTERALREEAGCAEALLLATCNRVEVYAAAADAVPTDRITRCLRANEDSLGESENSFYRHEERNCVQHLFRVASGLDSMVIGETEILGQAKKAYAAARESGGAGPLLHRLFQRAFRVAKQVRTRTEITRGAVSVGSVAVDLAEKIFGHFETRKVLLLGAGVASERTARALAKRGVRDIRVSNRSSERAATLAALVGGRAVAIEDWQAHCREVDILISSTAATSPIVTREKLEPLLRDRRDRPLFIIDISVPRDVAPDVHEMEGVFLYDIDSLQSIAQQSIAQRRQQIVAGEEIIAGHVDEVTSWLANACAGAQNPALTLRPSQS